MVWSSHNHHKAGIRTGKVRRRAQQADTTKRRRLQLETLEDRRLLAVLWERIEPLGSLMFEANISGEIGAPVAIFSDGFESGGLGPQWSSSSSSPGGRVGVSNVLGAPANSGSYHLAMDTTLVGNNLNEAILTLDLSGQSDVGLSFAHKDVQDEDHSLPTTFAGSFPGDGVSISDDGTTWHTLVSLNNANSPNEVYTDFAFDLDDAAANAGISLGANFQIKFQQFDNFPFNTDGRTFDDVAVTAPGPLTESTTVFLEADQTLTVVATPDDDSVTLTVTVRDPSNVVLASATAAGPGETLEIQTIGISADGDYVVEVSGGAAGPYDLTLYRNAAVEVVDSSDGGEQDATGSFIPLGSGRFGIVGQFTPSTGGGGQQRPIVWGIQPNSGEILKIDPQTGGIIDSFPAPDALSPNHRINGLTIAEGGDTLLYVNGGTNGQNLYRLDPNDGTVLSVEFLPTNGAPGFRGGLSFDSGSPDSIFAIDDGAPVDRQAGFGGPISDWTPAGAGFPGALGGDDNDRLFLFRGNEIQEFSTTVANTQLNAFPLPSGASGALGLAFDGVHLYLSDAQGNLFTLDPDTGAILNQVTVAGGFLSGLGADIVGGGGTVTSGPIFTTHQDGTRLGTIDKGTGAGTDIGPFGTSQTWAAAFGTDGTLYTLINGFSGNAVLGTVDQSTGAVTPIGSGVRTSMISLEVAADGTMYGIGYGDRILYEIDATTGTATSIGNTGISGNMDLAFDSAGVMYATVGNNIWTVDTASGNSTLLGSFTGILAGSVMGIMFDETDTLFATAYTSDSPLYEIDLTTLSASVIGTTTFVGPHGGDILITTSGPGAPRGQAITPAAMPDVYGDPGEPARFPPGLSAPAQQAAGTELLVNGSFETGNFTGWTTITTGGPFRPWAVTGAGQGGGFGMLQTQPQDGNFVAWNGFDGGGPMEFQLYQDISIPAGATATLSWLDRVQWNFTLGGQATLPRLYDVEIRDPVTNSVLQTVFSFSTGTQDTNPTGNTNWQTHSVDVSGFAGQTVRVFFREQIPQSGTGPGQIEFDAVSLATEQTHQPDVDEYLLDLTGKAGQPIDIALSTSAISDPEEVELITNGEFETGDFAGWTIDSSGSGTWQINDGTFDPNGPGGPLPPISGSFDAVTFQGGGGLRILSETIVVPTGVTSATLSWSDRIRNYAAAFSDPNQEWRVQILDGSGAVIQEVFSTNPGDPLQQVGPNQRSSDLTALLQSLEGQQIQISFEQQDNLGFFNATLDDVSLKVVSGGNAPTGVTLELLDTDGTTVLATGTAGADNFYLGILDFIVPADGVYTVRVSSVAPGRYGIVVTDPLVFDTEPNEPADSPLRSLNAYEGALGFLGEGAVTDVDLSLVRSFEALRFPTNSTFIPPDPIAAAGPGSLIAMVNTDIAIYDKATGSTIAQADLDGAGGFWATNNIVFDPWIIYDPESDRFFAMGVDRVTNATGPGGSSRIYLAVSTDSTPSNLTTDWHKYIIDRTGTHTDGTSGPTFPDYPKLGANDDAIYITGNDFGILGGGFSHVSLFAVEKAPLLSGGSVNIVYDEVITGSFSVHPVVVYDAGAPMYFAEAVGSGGGNNIRLHTLTDVLGTPSRTTTLVSVSPYNFPPDVPQQGGPPIDSVDARIMSGVVRDGSLWTAHSIQDPAVDAETVMRWYEFDVSGAPSLVQSGNVDPGPGVHTWMGHVNVDNDGDMAISFSVSGPSQFAGIGYTGRLATDPPGTTRPVQIARAGEGPYSLIDGIGRNRWGDYSGLAIDPDGETFWLYNEYAATGNTWATFVGAFQVEPGELQSEVDTYTITLAAGQQIGLKTSTPFDDPIDSLNSLDPTLEVLDPNGNSVALDTNSGLDGKNAAVPSFTAAVGGSYKVIVGSETDGAGEYVLSVNWAPVIEGLALSADEIFENESVSLAGSYSDQNLGDSHTVVVDWDDPNDSADSNFAVPAINTLSVGDTFGSTTDGAVLAITAVDLLTGQVSFVVTDHQYLDDGLAPGNGTAADRSFVTVTVTDDGGLVAASPTQEFMVNGDFETGDFTGWTVSGTASGNWLINDGTLDPSGPGTPLPPISGNFDAVSVESGPAVAILSEPIVVPVNVSSAVLGWSDRIRNFAGQGFADPGQEWRVLVLDSGGGLIQEVFSTNPGDPTQQVGPNSRSFDLTPLFQSLAGQSVRISFEQQSQFYYFNATLDNVSLLIGTLPTVLVKNVAPTLALDPGGTINENATFHLSGSLTDPGLLDEHQVIVDWDDPNDAADSTFILPSTSTLNVGDAFNSSTDAGVLTITAVDLSSSQVSFDVTHVYADDGLAPGNGTPSDTSTISVIVTDDDELNFPGFSDTTGLTPNGDAITTSTVDGTVLRLASTSTFDVGSAFSHVPVNATDGFSTQFAFRITNPGGVSDGTEAGADGFTFTLQTLGPDALGIAGGDLGFGGLAPSVAVEFDTWQNPWDPSTNHLGLDVNGSVVSLVTVDEPTNKWDNGNLYFVWIDYDGADLEVRVSTTNARPAAANLAAAIDIPGILGQSTAFAGFTAATGGAFGNHDIVNWRLTDLALAQTDVRVENVDPEITSVVVSATMENKAIPGDDVLLAATYTDIGLLDRHEVTIDWDDATPDSVFDVDATADLSVGDSFTSTSGDGAVLTITDVIAATGEVSFTVASHQFATGGIFEVAITIEDDDTGLDADGTIAWVTGVRLKDGELQIVGSNSDDQVTVNLDEESGLIKVHADFLLTGNFETFAAADVQHILAYLCSGDDHMNIAGSIKIPAIVHGGNGNDHVNAGGGPTVIDGGDGDDHLNGGNGRDILIGGLGADRLIGSAGEDILIGGTTSYDRNDDALMALLEEWNSERGYPERVENVRTGSGPILDGTGIKLEKGSTVLDDGDLDELTGSSGRDWFFFDPDEDQVNDLKANEESD